MLLAVFVTVDVGALNANCLQGANKKCCIVLGANLN